MLLGTGKLVAHQTRLTLMVLATQLRLRQVWMAVTLRQQAHLLTQPPELV